MNNKINEIINSREFSLVLDFLQPQNDYKHQNSQRKEAMEALLRLKKKLVDVLQEYIESVYI